MATLSFPQAFKYPFKRWVGLLNILWLLVPIYGWFLLIGYRVRILAEFLQGKYTKLPKIQHGKDFKLGWVMFWKAVPGILVLIVANLLLTDFSRRHGPSWVFILLAILVVPVLALNFIKKRTVASCFEFDLVRIVFKNFGDYLVALLKDFALTLVFIVMIVILVGFPSLAYTKMIFMTEWFRKYVSK